MSHSAADPENRAKIARRFIHRGNASQLTITDVGGVYIPMLDVLREEMGLNTRQDVIRALIRAGYRQTRVAQALREARQSGSAEG